MDIFVLDTAFNEIFINNTIFGNTFCFLLVHLYPILSNHTRFNGHILKPYVSGRKINTRLPRLTSNRCAGQIALFDDIRVDISNDVNQ